MKIIIAQFKAVTHKVEEVKKILYHVTEESRKEKGVIDYIFFQDNAHSECFFTLEKFKDKKALDSHLETPHVKQAINDLKGLLSQDIIVNDVNELD